MNIEGITAETLPLDKFPHIKFNEERLAEMEMLVACFNVRRDFLKESLDLKIGYEHNEDKILLIKTDMELARLHTSIIKKKTYLKDFRASCFEILKEMESKLNEVMAKGRLMSDKNPQLKEAMDNADKKLFEENWEAHISHYLTIKQILNPKKESKNNGSLSKV